MHTCIYITSALLFFTSFYTSSNLLRRLSDPDPSHRTQELLVQVLEVKAISNKHSEIFLKLQLSKELTIEREIRKLKNISWWHLWLRGWSLEAPRSINVSVAQDAKSVAKIIISSASDVSSSKADLWGTEDEASGSANRVDLEWVARKVTYIVPGIKLINCWEKESW